MKDAVFILYTGSASAQKVIQLTYCSIDENHLRMDCKYAVPKPALEVFCKYTQGERLLDTTDPAEEQHAPFKNKARARLFPGNKCRLLFKNLPKGKSNFTCNIRQDTITASKTSIVEKSKILLIINTRLPPVNVQSNTKDLRESQSNPGMLRIKGCPSEPAFVHLAELLLPCSAWSVLFQSCSGLMLTLMTLCMLLEIQWL